MNYIQYGENWWWDDYEDMNEHLWQNEWLHWGKRIIGKLFILYSFY